jgi:cell division transport system permease protein
VTPLQALAYFFQEAVSGLLRAWRASLLAVLTIAISLFVWGAFLLVERNLVGAMESWRAEARVIVYLRPAASASLQRQVVDWVDDATWVERAELVSPSEARRRFADAFPSLSQALEGWKESPLPPSIEIALRPGSGGSDLEAWLVELAGRPGVESVDDDRDWIGRLEALAATGRAVGLAVGLVLLAAAVLTTASVIRLAALMYREEISVMRIVGATEFLIRGPFYGEGLLQGGVGALLATGMLYAGYLALALRSGASGLLSDLLLARFLSPLQLALLLVVGCVAGLLGATISLRGGILRSGAG